MNWQALLLTAKLVKRWLGNNGIPVLFVTHDRDEARALGHRVLFLREGKIVGEGGAEETMKAASGF